MPKPKTIPQQQWSPEELALLHYIHSLRQRKYPHTFTREIINLNAGYGSRIIDDTAKAPPIAERTKIHDFEVLAQYVDRRISPPTSEHHDHVALWARVQLNGEYGPRFDIVEKYDVHSWTIHGGTKLEFKDDMSAKRKLKPKEVVEQAEVEMRFMSKFVWETKSDSILKNDSMIKNELKPEDDSKYEVDGNYKVDEKFKDNWRRKDNSRPKGDSNAKDELKPSNNWKSRDALDYKDDSKYTNDFRNRPNSIYRVDPKFTERSWRVGVRSGVVPSSDDPVHVFPLSF